MRQEVSVGNWDNRFRYFYDFKVKFYWTSSVTEHFHRCARRNEAERDKPNMPVKVIPVDKYEISTTPPPLTLAPPPPPPPPQLAASLKRRRSFHSVPQKEKFEKQRNEDELNENRSLPPPAWSEVSFSKGNKENNSKEK
ncbi:Uncharacterized protein Adt_34671 [Abeliophyllum distichum]|uniref:Uncharacterized protein n=1 Tax=Abeliophyllum distichum TaxID=126358 RepID=A0ABD1QZT6_9LAMI